MKTADGRIITFEIRRTQLGWIVWSYHEYGIFSRWECRAWRPTRKGCLRWIAAEKKVLSTPVEVIE